MSKRKSFMIIVIGVIGIVLLVILYFLAFRILSHDRRVDLLTLHSLSERPIQKTVNLRFSKGWQIRSEWLTETDYAPIGKVELSIKNNDNEPLMVIMQLDSKAVSALSKEFRGFKKQIEPHQQEIVFKGELNDFVGKIIRINNVGYLKTSFDIIMEAEKEMNLEKPLALFAYYPSQTI